MSDYEYGETYCDIVDKEYGDTYCDLLHEEIGELVDDSTRSRRHDEIEYGHRFFSTAQYHSYTFHQRFWSATPHIFLFMKQK